MPILFEGRGWKKKPGWFSETWNFLSGIYNLLLDQAQVKTILTSIASRLITKTTRIRFYTVSMPVANHQYSFVLPPNTKSIEIQTTDGTAFRVSFDSGRVGPVASRPYWSVSTNTSWDKENLDLTGATLYFACGTAGVTMELAIGT